MATKKTNTYDVVLEKAGNQQLKTTKALCSALGLGLAAAKGMVDKAPTTVAKELDKDAALALKKQLENLDNIVSITGMETKKEAPATKKTTTTKKQTAKKSAPSPSKAATPSNDDFDAIFGGGTAQTTTKATKAKSAPKVEIRRIENNNGSYEGEMLNGNFHGHGIYRWNSGNSYDGEWLNGNLHGHGIYRWADGDVYEGKFQNDIRQGKGKFIYASGSTYEGDFVDGKFHGYGIYRWADGDVYDGEWQNGKRHGNGKWIYADGSYYTGVWENGERVSASALMRSSNEVKTERIKYDDGGVYEGETVDGSRHGKGKYTYPNGGVYEGDWLRGKKTGFGIYKTYDKNEVDGTTFTSYIYEGEWKDGKKHGHGVAKGYKVFPLFGHVYMSWSYDGSWVDDNKHGRGVYREWDGNATSEHWKVYEGEWNDDKRHGIFVWHPEPAAKDLKYIDYYEHGKEVVGYIDYDPSIKTLDDARRAKETECEENERVMDERRTREVAQSSSPSDTSSDSDSEAVWEEFEYVEDMIEKLKNPELFDDPEDRWIANAYQYFEAFMDDVAANYSDADFATASEIFSNILDLDVNGLQNYLNEKLGYIGDHYYVDYIETCLNYACLHVTKDALIPFANLCYFRTKEIGINYMDLYVKAYSRHYVAKGEDILWFERYACNGDGFVSLSDEDDSRGNERGYGDSLRQMLTNGYRMGSDCHLYLPMKSLSEPNASPSVGETYRMYHILSHVYDVGEWSGYSPYEDTDYQTWEHGSFAMDTYMAWMENEDEHTILFRNDGFTKRTGSRKGDYSKRRVALIPLRNYISNAMLANEQVRKSVPLSERLLYQRKLNEMVEEAMEYVRKGCIGAAFDEFQDAFDGGYEPKRLAEICYDVVRDVLQKNEDHWEFDDPYVEIMKLVALCDPESYAYFMSSIARESFGNYNHKYIYEVLTGEEYPG